MSTNIGGDEPLLCHEFLHRATAFEVKQQCKNSRSRNESGGKEARSTTPANVDGGDPAHISAGSHRPGRDREHREPWPPAPIFDEQSADRVRFQHNIQHRAHALENLLQHLPVRMSRPSTVLSAMSRLPALTWIFARTCDCIATIAPLRSPAFSATDLTIMTSSELQNLIVATLTRNAGGSRRRWRLVVGPVRVYSLGTHPHCNWSVAPSGSAGENTVVEDLIDTIRSAHPIVAAG
ncbi:hypothetical protein [Sphingomonas fennica]|nr:hypothetical protein [Sphingomonas fennica]